jgi:hypothetical protein
MWGLFGTVYLKAVKTGLKNGTAATDRGILAGFLLVVYF